MDSKPSRSVWLGSLNVTETIDTRPLSALGLRVVILCVLIMMLDGFDIQVITFVAPVLTESLGVTRSMLGPVFSIGLVGTTMGALIFGTLADRFGRKPVFLTCVLIFGLCTLGTITASGVAGLMIWRFLAGLALGGTTPIAVALTAEFSPIRSRGTTTIIVCCGFPIGASVGGFLVAHMLPIFGWQSAFVLGGAVPLALFGVALVMLPQSMGDLARRGRSDLVAETIKRIAPDARIDAGAEARLGSQEAGSSIGRLFAEGRTARTVVLWIMFFTNILSLYFMVSWLPTLANASGLEVPDAVRAAAFSQVGSVVGTLVLAALVRRFDAFVMIGLGYLCGVGSLLLLAFAGSSVTSFTVIAFLAGFFVIGFQTGANAVSGLAYPDRLRSTGVGWALGIGRVGAIVGPTLGGLLIGLGWPTRDLFIAAAGPAVIASFSALLISRMLKRSSEASGANGVAIVGA